MACALPLETFSEEDDDNKTQCSSDPSTESSGSTIVNTLGVPEIRTKTIEKTLLPLVQQVSLSLSPFSLL